jgi:hypothetical protein
MATVVEHGEAMHSGSRSLETHSFKEVETGTVSESISGAGALALAILALIGVIPSVLGPIAVIAAGLALLAGGGAIAARALDLVGTGQPREVRRQILGGLGMEALTGGAGGVLGLLALLGISPMTLLPVAGIVLGTSLLMASGALTRLESLINTIPASEHETSHRSVYVATSSDFLVGLGAIVLGILALAGYSPITLSLVAVISIGAAVLMSGSTLAVRFAATFGR